MTSVARPASSVRADLRTILGGGAKLGLITAVGVAAFALLSRPISGLVEMIVQSVLVLAGGIVFSFAPALWVRPKDVDSIAWASLVGLLGALAFTVFDIVLLRPLSIYHWTWDEIGGGSGFWYIPVWWMGSAVLAWLGAWIYASAKRSGQFGVAGIAGLTVSLALVCFAGLGMLSTGFSAATMALAFALALVLRAVVAVVRRRS